MANYSLVAGAQFRPFSYQELMAPIARMNEVQGQLEEQYDALSAQADVLEAMGKNDRDKSVYNQYKAFSDALRAEADNLYRNGLTSDSRLRLSDMKRRYSKEIVPILNAWAKRKQEADVQMKAQMADPTLMFTRNANTTSLQNYIDNPEGGFTTISGKNIASQVGTGAAALAEEIRMNPNGEAATRLKHLDPFTYETIVKRGFTSAEIADWQNRPALRSIVENVLAANGVTRDNLGDRFDSIYSQSLGYAVPALNQAVGKTTVGTMADYYKQKMLDFDLDEMKADNAAIRATNAKANDELNMPDWSEENVGIKTSKGYVTNAPEIISELKGGNNGLKASYFGNVEGQVNPLQIYDDFQEERKKHTKYIEKEQEVNNPYTITPQKVKVSTQVPDNEKAKEAVLKKYAKYGVKDIISTEQYDLLKGMGYTKNSKFGTRYSDLEEGLNKLATKYTRYSTKMAGYDLPDEDIRMHISRLPNTYLSGKMWKMQDDGSLGKPITNKNELDLKTNSNTKGGQVQDIQYDPQHKGKLLITIGDKRYIVSPDVIDAQLTKALNMWEAAGYDPRVITGRISNWLNSYNPVQSKSSSKANQ